MAKPSPAAFSAEDQPLPGSVYAERVESKFLVPESKACKIENRVGEELPREKFPDNKEGVIWSVYFDNARLLCYRHQAYGHPYPFKVRFRRYGNCPNGFWEIKEKCGETVYKSRVPVSLRSELDLGEELAGADTAPESGKILDRIKRYRLIPMLVVRQHRNAYEDKHGKFRITFDRFLRVRPVALKSKEKESSLLQDHVVIMEIKRAAHDAKGFVAAMQHEFHLEELGFSKYCRATEVLCGTRAGFVNWVSALCHGVIEHDAGHVWKNIDE